MGKAKRGVNNSRVALPTLHIPSSSRSGGGVLNPAASVHSFHDMSHVLFTLAAGTKG